MKESNDVNAKPIDEVNIEVLYDEDFYNEIESGSLRPWTGMRVAVGDTYVVGGDEGGIKGWPGLVIVQLLDTIEDTLNDDTASVEFQFGPYYLGIQPRDSTTLFIGGYHFRESIVDPARMLDVIPEDQQQRMLE